MALTKSIAVDRIEILAAGQLQVRTATVVAEDGVELSRSFHRHVLEPGADTTGEAIRVASVAAAVWTDDVLADWQAYRAAQEAQEAARP